jgi:hypothetical protein
MTTIKLAFDRSARRIDADGRLHVDRSHISKATVNPYYGNEIPGYEELGLDPTKVYRLLRDPVELERGAPTFARLPILSKHVPVTVDSPQPDLVVGSIGSEVIFDSPYLTLIFAFGMLMQLRELKLIKCGNYPVLIDTSPSWSLASLKVSHMTGV